MINPKEEQGKIRPQETEEHVQFQPEKSASEIRNERLAQINQELKGFDRQTSSSINMQQIQEQREREFQSKVAELEKDLGTKLGQEGVNMIHENIVGSVVEQTQKDNEKFNELQRGKNQLEKINAAESLITRSEGRIDHKTAPYKDFDTRKYDRFLIQKGELSGVRVVFKVGEIKTDKHTVKTESRNLQAIEQEKIKLLMFILSNRLVKHLKTIK